MSDVPRRPGKFPMSLERMARSRPASMPSATSRPVPAFLPSADGSAGRGDTPVSAPSGRRRDVLRPQAPLQHAAVSQSMRARLPTGLGLDSAGVRRQMVERLRAGGLKHPRVLAALSEVPRHLFVDAALVNQAYEDTSLPIGHGQTISKPSVVGRMIELLMDGANAKASGGLGRTLEIGTGCGYQVALLSSLSRHVVSIERLKPLHGKARELLAPIRQQRGGDNIRLVHGDGMLGHPPNAPYDSIVSAAGGERLPDAWLQQLAVGGRLVAPVEKTGDDGRTRQMLVVVDRNEAGLTHSVHESVLFVPLKSGVVR